MTTKDSSRSFKGTSSGSGVDMGDSFFDIKETFPEFSLMNMTNKTTCVSRVSLLPPPSQHLSGLQTTGDFLNVGLVKGKWNYSFVFGVGDIRGDGVGTLYPDV